jgi:long-subunit fatty acid transport protein
MIKKLALLSLTTATLLATNGVNLIGTGVVSRSMGGTGVAFYSSGVEAIGKNPALMAHSKKNELEMSLTYFSASVETSTLDTNPLFPSDNRNDPQGSTATWQMNFLPGMGGVYILDEDITLGFAMIGAAGLAVDYKGVNEAHQLRTAMLIVKMVPALSYKIGNMNIGIAPQFALGSLSIDYDENMEDRHGVLSDGTADYLTQKNQSQRAGLFGSEIGGPSLVPSVGMQIGIDGKVNDKLRVGMTYQSSMTYKYKNVANFTHFGWNGFVWQGEEFLRINEANVAAGNGQYPSIENLPNSLSGLAELEGSLKGALESVGVPSIIAGLVNSAIPDSLLNESLNETGSVRGNAVADSTQNLDDLTMEQPWEVAIGFAYDATKDITVTMDYRYVAWGEAQGYKDFGWGNQNIIAFGFELRRDDWQFRGGYNYADNPLAKVPASQAGLGSYDVQGHQIFKQARSMLTTVAFPAISTTHFTFGVGHDISEDIHFNSTLVYSPAVTYIATGRLVPDLGQPDLKIAGIDTQLPYGYKTTMTQMSLSFGLNYQF